MKFDIGPKLINHAFALRAFLRVTNFAKPEMEGSKVGGHDITHTTIYFYFQVSNKLALCYCLMYAKSGWLIAKCLTAIPQFGPSLRD